ncbi:MAG TPA: M28 family metallopeptidase [Candidatus Acidoferrales bacterium]|nr:M28 family metallopeptidase [Candidatus Acidoferrales bacterium]
MSTRKQLAPMISFIACLAAAGAAGQAARVGRIDWQAAGQRWWAHIEYLASNDLQGRGTGTPGFQKAAAYVAAQFKNAGLEPAGLSGYFQPVDFIERQPDESNSTAALVSGGKAAPLAIGEDVRLGLRGDLAAVDAPAVFVGYGFAVPELHYDDFAHLDLRGKIALYLSGGPKGIPSALMAHSQSAAERWKAMRQAGAIGMASIQNPRTMEIPWNRGGARPVPRPVFLLADPALDEVAGLRLSMTVNPAHADRFFQGSGHSFQELLADADAGRPLPHFPLAVSIRAHAAYREGKAVSPNVVGLLPGADPELKKEYVVISAHLDHLGVGTPVNGDPIYHGAMDDASGVASLIEVARGFRSDRLRPKRSILFLAVTAEEQGELGSIYFARHPTVPPGQIVADLNMDMFLPLFPLKYLEVQGLAESTLGDDIRAVCRANGVIVQADKVPSANRFIRSDQYSFVKTGVPALAFKFGWTFGSPEEKTFNDWIHTRYHSPDDNLSQPVDKAAAAQFDRILEQLALRVADAAGRPAWEPDSFFRRFAAPPAK